MNNQTLLARAYEAQQQSYAPYSKFHVGAALLTNSGLIFTGCNIENASYGAAICAERVAFSKAISEGHKNFDAIAIVGSHHNHTYPCGICRQFMAEFGLDLRIITTNKSIITEQSLAEFLPQAFTSFQTNQELVVKHHNNELLR